MTFNMEKVIDQYFKILLKTIIIYIDNLILFLYDHKQILW